MPTVYKEVEVDIDLSDIETDDLMEELENRGCATDGFEDGKEILEQIWLKRRNGLDYQQELDDLIYAGLGRIV